MRGGGRSWVGGGSSILMIKGSRGCVGHGVWLSSVVLSMVRSRRVAILTVTVRSRSVDMRRTSSSYRSWADWVGSSKNILILGWGHSNGGLLASGSIQDDFYPFVMVGTDLTHLIKVGRLVFTIVAAVSGNISCFRIWKDAIVLWLLSLGIGGSGCLYVGGHGQKYFLFLVKKSSKRLARRLNSCNLLETRRKVIL